MKLSNFQARTRESIHSGLETCLLCPIASPKTEFPTCSLQFTLQLLLQFLHPVSPVECSTVGNKAENMDGCTKACDKDVALSQPDSDIAVKNSLPKESHLQSMHKPAVDLIEELNKQLDLPSRGKHSTWGWGIRVLSPAKADKNEYENKTH